MSLLKTPSNKSSLTTFHRTIRLGLHLVYPFASNGGMTGEADALLPTCQLLPELQVPETWPVAIMVIEMLLDNC